LEYLIFLLDFVIRLYYTISAGKIRRKLMGITTLAIKAQFKNVFERENDLEALKEVERIFGNNDTVKCDAESELGKAIDRLYDRAEDYTPKLKLIGDIYTDYNLIGKTKKGYLCLYESGGGRTRTGGATVITGKNGERLKPICVFRKGNSKRQHAVLPANEGNFIINYSRDKSGERYIIYEIVKIDRKTNTAFFRKVENAPAFLKEAMEVVKEKASIYHCKKAMYVKELGRQ